MVVEILPPIAIVSSEWDGIPITPAADQWQNVDETMAAIDTADYNEKISSNKTIKHISGKLTNIGLLNSIKLALNVKRFRTQGVAALRLNVYLAGQRIVPETEVSVDSFIAYNASQVVWLANAFLDPWVGLTGQQWNDEIDLDSQSAQYWLETFAAAGPVDPPLDYQGA